MRAGLINAFKQRAIKNLHSERWLYEIMKPGREPIKKLFDGLYAKIDKRANISVANKEDLKGKVKEIQSTVTATQKNKR